MTTVRHYRPGDRNAVERINYDTGLLGRSLAELGVSRELISRGFRPYLDACAEYAFVADAESAGVVGYVVGAPAGTESKTAVLLRVLANVCRLPRLGSADRRYVRNQLRVLLNAGLGRGEEGRFKTPSGALGLHINMLPGFRGRGTGRELLTSFVSRVKQDGIANIYADSYLTGRNPNRGFWIRNGFREYSRIRSSVWNRVYPAETIYLVCYTKEIA